MQKHANEQRELGKKKKIAKAHKKVSKTLLVVLSLAVMAAAGYLIYANLQVAVDNTEDFSEEPTGSQNFEEYITPSGKLAVFTGEEFRDLYNDFAYPNTQFISEDAVIFNDPEVDAYIREVAESRGYERRSAPVLDTFFEVEPNMLLQQRAVGDWEALSGSAKEDGIELFLTAAYRSADDQRNIFINRLAEIGLTEELIASKQFDNKLNEILATTAVPGYSRHHTGYTIDIGCGNSPETEFEFTVCFNWLSESNYLKAKENGWIPSYPEKGGLQGPEPETWEYVWVGKESLYE